MFNFSNNNNNRIVVYNNGLNELEPLNPSPVVDDLFSSLPVEIHYKIIDLLPIKTILNLRRLNKHFKQFVDSYAKIWKKLNLKLDLDQMARNNTITVDLDAIELFLHKIPHFDLIEFKCESVLTREKKIELNLRLRKNNSIGLRANRSFTIRTRELNIASTVNSLNLIANSCEKLIIESFFKSNPHQRSFNKTENAKCLKFEHLTCLDLNCATFSHYDGSLKQEFRNINNICVDQMVDLFPNLVHLHLQHYNDSTFMLYEKLIRLPRLKLIEFYQVSTHPSFNLNWEFLVFEKNMEQPYTPNKLKIETYLLRSTRFETIKMYLGHFSDLSYLKCLSLFRVELFNSDFENLLELMSSRLPNLHCLSTDMFQGKNLDESLNAASTRMVRALFARLDEIYLWECNSIYENLPNDCGSCHKKSVGCTSYEYSFGLFDFNRLFNGAFVGNERLVAKKVVLHFVQVCFCDSPKSKKITDHVVAWFKANAKCLNYLELRFKCTPYYCNNYFVKSFNNFSSVL